MAELFRNKYRIKSIRLQHWDYSSNGAYFITICTKNRKPYFGKILNGGIELLEIGVVVRQEWLKTGQIRPNVKLDEFIIMPDHFHGIVIIDNDSNVEACGRMPLPPPQLNKFSKPIKNSISIIVNNFKSMVKRWCNENNHPDFQWQAGFYEHIIRNDDSLHKIRKYIRKNPYLSH